MEVTLSSQAISPNMPYSTRNTCTPAYRATWDWKSYQCDNNAAQPEILKGKRTTIPTIQDPHLKPGGQVND
jgi:hypothetical protein